MTSFPFGGSSGGGGGPGSDTTAIHTDTAAEISTITEKVAPVGADILVLEDSAAAFAKRRVQLTNLPTGAGNLAAVLALGNLTGNNSIEFSGTSLGITTTAGSGGAGKTLNIASGAGDGLFTGGTIDIRPGAGGLTGQGGQLNLVAGNSGASGGLGQLVPGRRGSPTLRRIGNA